MTTQPRARRRRRRRTSHVGTLVALISTVSAISLNDFQAVQDGVLPMPCSLVYHATIQGCTSNDFRSRLSCSRSCIAGLREIENDVENQCNNVAANSNSLALLYDAQRGSLVLQLCIDNDFTLVPSRTSTPIVSTTRTPVVTTSKSIGSFTIIPTPTPPAATIPAQTSTSQHDTVTQTTFTIVPPPQSTTSQLTTPQLTTSLAPPISETSSPLSTSTTPTTEPVTSTSTTSTAASATSTSTTSTAASATSTSSNDDSGRGGGSPFDTVSSASGIMMGWSLLLPFGAALAGLGL